MKIETKFWLCVFGIKALVLTTGAVLIAIAIYK